MRVLALASFLLAALFTPAGSPLTGATTELPASTTSGVSAERGAPGATSEAQAGPSPVFAVAGEFLSDTRLRVIRTVDQSNGRVVGRCVAASIGNFAILTSYSCLAKYCGERDSYYVSFAPPFFQTAEKF